MRTCGFRIGDVFWPCFVGVKVFYTQLLHISVSLGDALKRFTGMYRGRFSAGLWTMPSGWVRGGTTRSPFVSSAVTWHGEWRRAAWSCIFISWLPNAALLHRSTTEWNFLFLLLVYCDFPTEETITWCHISSKGQHKEDTSVSDASDDALLWLLCNTQPQNLRISTTLLQSWQPQSPLVHASMCSTAVISAVPWLPFCPWISSSHPSTQPQLPVKQLIQQ